MSEYLKVKWQDRDFLLIGNKEEGGAIATEEQYYNFKDSEAHLFPNGIIRQYGKKVGTIDDLIFSKEETS